MSIEPSRQQARIAWETAAKPSARTVADILKAAGFKISFRTLARWKKQGWQEPAAPSALDGKRRKPQALKRLIQDELDKLPPETVAEANEIAAAGGLQAAIEGGHMKDEDYTRIDLRIKALAPKKAADLIEMQDRARTIMNIVMMEEATRKAHVMILLPKDAGSFLADAAEASKANAFVAPIEVPEPNGNGAMIEVKSTALSPMAEAIRRVREKANA